MAKAKRRLWVVLELQDGDKLRDATVHVLRGTRRDVNAVARKIEDGFGATCDVREVDSVSTPKALRRLVDEDLADLAGGPLDSGEEADHGND